MDYTVDDLEPGASFMVEDGMAITPILITVQIHWVDSNTVYYTKPPLQSIKQTSIKRFLKIINHSLEKSDES